MLENCQFPNLPAKYDTALREAVAFVLESYKPVGIIASGTIVRGNPDPTSDLDLWVIHRKSWRQRVQKFFNAIPAEIFINPPWVIENYFTQEQASARPISAHLMATGFVVLASDPVVEELRRRAAWLLTQPPNVTPEAVERARYEAATWFEDATDIAARDPVGAGLLLSQSLIAMLRCAFLKARRFIPRDKELVEEFSLFEPDTAAKVRQFFETSDCDGRIRLATEIADRILGARGFFAWSSEPESKPEPDSHASLSQPGGENAARKSYTMKQAIVHVALVVRDYDEAIEFYTKQLHFRLVEDTYQPEQGKRWVVVSPPGSVGTTLLLARAATPEQASFIGNQSGGRVFLFLNTDDFWRDYQEMASKGIKFVRGPKQESYGLVAVFEDLYGNLWDLLELNHDHPISRRSAQGAG